MTSAEPRTWQVYDDDGRRKYLNREERARLLGVCDGLTPSIRCLCLFLAFTGCRISEALMLHRHQLDTVSLTVTIQTLKRRRTMFRSVPIPEFLAHDLSMLPAAEDGRLWLIHRSTAWRRVKLAMAKAGISGPMASCKGLRHGFGIRAAECNVPPNLIQRFLGHASPETTAIYLDAVGVEERQFAARMW